MEDEEKKESRKRSNPSPEIEINIHLKVIAKPKEKALDIRGFTIEPEGHLTIAEIGFLLGENVGNFLVQNTKPSPKIEV